MPTITTAIAALLGQTVTTKAGAVTFDKEGAATATDDQAACFAGLPGYFVSAGTPAASSQPAPTPQASTPATQEPPQGASDASQGAPAPQGDQAAPTASMKAEDAIKDIATSEDRATLAAIVAAEKRPTVRKAAEERLAALDAPKE